MYHDQSQDRDDLRARFTRWVEVVAYRTRLNYLRDSQSVFSEVPLDRVAEEYYVVRDVMTEPANEFDFAEERLAQAFSQLPNAKKRVLIMLYVQEKLPEEIAQELGCTVQNVYNQRSLALKKLRAALEGGKHHD